MKNRPLQYQIRWGIALLVLLPSLLVMGIYTLQQIQMMREKSLELIRQRVDFQEQLIQYWEEERLSDVRQLTRLDAFLDLDLPAMQRQLELLQQGNRKFDSLCYLDPQGRLRLSTLGQDGSRCPAPGETYVDEGLAGREAVSGMRYSQDSGRLIQNFSCPLYGRNGQFRGLVVGAVRLDTLEKLLQQRWIGGTGEVLLLDREGLPLLEPRNLKHLVDQGLAPGSAQLRRQLPGEALEKIGQQGEGVARWRDYQGQQVLGVYKYLPQWHWLLLGSVAEDEIFSLLYRQLTWMSAGILLVLLIFISLANRLTRYLKRPVDWLMAQSQLVATGRYERVGCERPAAAMPYELRSLCATFIEMSQTIAGKIRELQDKETVLADKVREIEQINSMLETEILEKQVVQQELQALNTKLEDRVRARTQQLQEINSRLEEEIRERQEAQEALRKLSVTDSLTGLYNRGHLTEHLEAAVAEAQRYGTPLSLVMFDLDHFKRINDTYGHLEGDRVLQAVARCLQTHIRGSDVLGRYGGEEFALVLPRANAGQGCELAERLRLLVAGLRVGERQIAVTLSGGVASYGGEGLSEFLRRADAALYRAKEAGRNHICCGEE